ncbi:MAG: hypothetical protein JXO49_10800 [Deltaproteobacteria bacterium]|nr:hypothetical protein [Candidatus Anaeroferrophillus wilburensis]MBN2889820.1 hypothetical protein [Deltaproteobacteria bacterium]
MSRKLSVSGLQAVLAAGRITRMVIRGGRLGAAHGWAARMSGKPEADSFLSLTSFKSFKRGNHFFIGCES